MKHKDKLILVLLIVLSMGTVKAQEAADKVVKKDGTTVDAILSEITTEEIKFKKASYPTGPTYTLPLKQVKKIILATGEEEVFDIPDDKPKVNDKPIDATPFGAQKFLVYSEDGQSIVTDLIFPDNNRYLCVWNTDLELIKKIEISKYWSSYSQQVTGNGNYLDKSVYYASDGTELKRFKHKEFGFNTELSGWKYPGIVSPSGKRFLINEHASGKSDREDFYLYNEKGEFIKNYHHHSIYNFLFSHKNNLFYIITGHVSSFPCHIEIYDSVGIEVGTVKVKSIMNNVSFFLEDKTVPQFSFDDQYIISKNTYTDVVVADVKGNVIRHLYSPMANAMTFSRDGKKIATAGNTYFGHSQKIEDEKGNKIEYAGGSIRIWSFEGQLIKEINFPARVDYLQFTPDNDGLVVLIGDTGSCVWLWEKEDYKLPEGFEKTVNEMAKYQGEKHDKAVKDSRLDFWIDMTVTMYKTMTVGAAKVQANKNRLLAEEKKAFALSDAIAKRNAKQASTLSTGQVVKTQPKHTCNYAFKWRYANNDYGKRYVKLSNVFATNLTGDYNNGEYSFKVFASKDNARDQREFKVEDWRADDLSIQSVDEKDGCTSQASTHSSSPSQSSTESVAKPQTAKRVCNYAFKWKYANNDYGKRYVKVSNVFTTGLTGDYNNGEYSFKVFASRDNAMDQREFRIEGWRDDDLKIESVDEKDSCSPKE